MKTFLSFVTGFLVGGIMCSGMTMRLMATDQDYHDGVMRAMK